MHLDKVIRYKQSNMLFAIHSDASYLSQLKECSRVGWHFFLANKPKQGQLIVKNGAVHVISTIIHNVMPLEVEAEISAFYLNT